MLGSIPRVDYALVGILLSLGCVEVSAAEASTPVGILVALAVAITSPLVLRRQFPLAVALAVVAASAAVPTDVDLPMFQFMALLLATWSVGLYGLGDRAYVGLGAVLLYFVVGFLYDRAQHASANPGELVFVALIFGGAWTTARALRTRQERAAALERARDEDAQAAVTAERGRIARELHDVVAHAVSVMVVQAGAADQLLESDPVRSRQALHAIQDAGRQAIDELRRLLGILRSGNDDGRLEPQPGPDALRGLLDDATAAGTPVRVEVVGAERPLPPGVGLCAYRVIQEALTNVRRHAPGAETSVTVSFRPDAIELDILNAIPNGSRTAPGGGHGLVGMRERVNLYGGTCKGRSEGNGRSALLRPALAMGDWRRDRGERRLRRAERPPP